MGSNMVSVGKTILGAVPHLVLTAALLLYLPWVLGIPGTPSAEYVDGWYIGFYEINSFIALYAMLGVLGIISRLGWLPIPFGWVRTVLWCSTGAFALVMAIAFYAIFN